jgi:hypothetical protein
MLPHTGFNEDSSIAIAQDIAGEGEVMKMTRLGDILGKKGPSDKYFSIMVAKKKDDRK